MTSFAETALGSSFTNQVGGSHYKNRAIQPIQYILANNLNFLEGCVVKRITRWRDKNGIEDLEKAIHEIQMLIEHTKSGGQEHDEVQPINYYTEQEEDLETRI